MFNSLINRFSATLTIKISDERLKIFDEDELEIFNDVPVIALGTKDNGGEYVVEVGKKAMFHTGKNTKIYKPFSNPRIIIDNHEVAEVILRYAIEKGLKRKKFFAPKIIVDIEREFENDFTLVESRLIEDVMENVGAREVVLKDK